MSFSLLIKPASSLCNLRCRYCFYADVSKNRENASFGCMKPEVAHTLIDRAFAASHGGTVSFAFQGGEPTVAGLDFFRDFTAYADEHCPKGTQISYTIQTNGILLDDEWCAFLKEHAFLVGLSLDGPKQEHDLCRVDAQDRGTFQTVMQTVQRLRAHHVDFNILTVLTKTLARHPQQLFSFYKKNDLRFVQIIPCLDSLEDGGGAYSLTPELYASFLKTFFRLWLDEFRRGNYISVRLFDNLVRMAAGQHPEQCGLLGQCQCQFVAEADGSLYPCDFYVLDPYRMGNVMDMPLEDMFKSEGYKAFLADNESSRNPQCETCWARPACGGGCRRYRPFYFTKEDYCPYADFLTACARDIRWLARILSQEGGI